MPQVARAASAPAGSSLIRYTVCRVSPVVLATSPTQVDLPSIPCALSYCLLPIRLRANVGSPSPSMGDGAVVDPESEPVQFTHV
jgi:hypothetical protein